MKWEREQTGAGGHHGWCVALALPACDDKPLGRCTEDDGNDFLSPGDCRETDVCTSSVSLRRWL